MAIQTKTMTVKSDTALAETTTTIRDTVTFDVSKMPNGITYKGLKAVLSFADPIQWNKASTYDSLTVVWDDATHASYASKRPVPQNIELTNEFYWLRTADLDAQVEMYRREVAELNEKVSLNSQAILKNSQDILKNSQGILKNSNAINDINSPIVIIYGDSWSDFTESESNWTNLVAKQLGCIRKNYSKSGATITDIGETTIKTLTTEVDESISELSSVSERVKYIFVLMGVNDITHNKTDSEILTTLAQQLTRVRNAFPKALISFSFNFPCHSQSKYMPHVNYFKSFAFNRGYRYVDLGSLMFAPDLYKADKLHPTNGAGTGYIAGRMLGSQTDVRDDEYIIKNDDEALCSIIYTPHGAVLNTVFKTATKISLGDMQVKVVNALLGTSDKGAVVLTTDTDGNYITALNSLSTKTSFKSLIYA